MYTIMFFLAKYFLEYSYIPLNNASDLRIVILKYIQHK